MASTSAARRLWFHALALAALAALAGCGGASSGGGSSSSSSSSNTSTAILAGSWYGVYEDYAGNLGRLTVTVASDGTFTSTVTGGTYNDGSDSGTIQHIANSTWGTDSAGTAGGFMCETDAPSTPAYAGFVDEDFNFAVLQKGATNLPSYTTSDVNGSWTGTGVYLSGVDFGIVETYGVSVGVSYPSFSGSDTAAGAFTGSFTATSLANGGFGGNLTQASLLSDIEVFLSADKNFAGYWSCQSGGSFPDDCGFGILR